MHSVGNIFRPLSSPAQYTYEVSLLTMATCAAIFLVVAGLLAYTIVRFRAKQGDSDREPPQIYGSNQIEIAWTVLPILIVFVLTMATARVVSAIQDRRPTNGSLQVTVIGHQWWWEFRYPAFGVVTANELHVPLSSSDQPRPTFLRLESADVAHSFWVPQLAGKTDLIPNRVNTMWIEPKALGIFLGNCAEYCGTEHAKMLIRVVVQRADEFERWIREQSRDAASTGEGQQEFLSLSCVNCHTVRGTSAKGTFGPDLTHLMSRQTLGSGALTNDPKNLLDWVRNPDHAKPGSLMPNMQLTGSELKRVVGYLTTLQ